MCLVSPPRRGGTISTRTFIPHRMHESIGVLGAVSVATACVTPGSVAADVANLRATSGSHRLEVEHPTGFFTVDMDVAVIGASIEVRRAALLRTARKLLHGEVFVPGSVWRRA
jgi:4-oxalomesaconate tautomerase